MTKAIYVITNKLNGKQYVGQSVHPGKRWCEHKQRAKTRYDNYPIHLAISKYGEENFDFEVIEWTEDYDNREIQLIKELNTLSPNGYNVATGGGNYVAFGENHPRNTISEDTVLNIINDLKNSKLSDRDIAKKYGCTDKVVADVNHGYSHRQDNEKYPIRKKSGLQKLTLEQAKEVMFKLVNTQISYQKLADEYDVTKGVIYNINKGLTFYDSNNTYPLR